jgi:uncharacterized protein (TIGR03083 family)
VSLSADRIISTLRAGHDDIVRRVSAMTADDLAARSGATEWSVAQVLSHLGSAAEINHAMLARSLDSVSVDGSAGADGQENQRIWDRWNAMTPEQQAIGFIESNGRLVEAYEAIDARSRAESRIDLGYLPAPVDVATAAGFRLNEFTLHGWDVRVASDPEAELDSDAAEQLLDMVPIMLGWLAKPDVLDEPMQVAVELTDTGRVIGLTIDEQTVLGAEPARADALLALPTEAFIRLLFGRLGPDHTPAAVKLDGAVTLDRLRQVFPGI